MQHNPGQKTIEGVVMDALHKAGAVTDDNAGDFSKVHSSGIVT
jgi:tRNA U38,U39,U40 pseudouridine synthase TruA